MLISKLRVLFVAALIIPFISLTGCNDAGSGQGSLQVRLHDAPIDSADAVNVFIERVEINNLGSDTGWTVLSRPNASFDLLKLSNGNFDVLADTMLPAGRYEQIRLILSPDKHSVVIDGTSYDMFVPSGAQTGVKLEVSAEIEEDIETVILLDFDASRSVVEAGVNQQVPYLLQPVVRATVEAITGNIEGSVDPAESRPVVRALQNSVEVASAVADTVDGYFKLVGLEEGTYTISVEPRNDNYSSTQVSGVSVTVGETNDIGTIQVSSN